MLKRIHSLIRLIDSLQKTNISMIYLPSQDPKMEAEISTKEILARSNKLIYLWKKTFKTLKVKSHNLNLIYVRNKINLIV